MHVLRYYKRAIEQMCLKGVTAPFGCTSGWVALGGLEYLTTEVLYVLVPTAHLNSLNRPGEGPG